MSIRSLFVLVKAVDGVREKLNRTLTLYPPPSPCLALVGPLPLSSPPTRGTTPHGTLARTGMSSRTGKPTPRPTGTGTPKPTGTPTGTGTITRKGGQQDRQNGKQRG